jgi:hypothetical protein
LAVFEEMLDAGIRFDFISMRWDLEVIAGLWNHESSWQNLVKAMSLSCLSCECTLHPMMTILVWIAHVHSSTHIKEFSCRHKLHVRPFDCDKTCLSKSRIKGNKLCGSVYRNQFTLGCLPNSLNNKKNHSTTFSLKNS